MDSEAYGTIIIGSAGASSVKISFKNANTGNFKIDQDQNTLFELSVDGLKAAQVRDIHLLAAMLSSYLPVCYYL